MANIMNTNNKLLVLKHYIDGLESEKKFRCLKDLKEFENIISKPQSSSFKDYTFDDLSTDIAKLVEQVKKDKSKAEFSAAKLLKKEWSVEIKTINKCIDCYFYWTTRGKNKDYFTSVCTKPHLLVYVQTSERDGLKWWPAKVLSVNDDDTVSIECFGDHHYANYDIDQCILYCGTKNANKSKNKIKKINVDRAFKEIQMYIKNIEEKYGDESFVPASSEDQMITDVNQHLKEMFPAAFAPENPIAPEVTKSQATPTNDQHDSDGNDGSFPAAPHSPVSQGYGSRGSQSDDSNNSIEAEQVQCEFRLVRIKSEYRHYVASAQPDIQPQAESIAETRKRKSNSDVIKRPAVKREASSNNEVITIDDDYERPSTSSQNHDQRNSAKSDVSNNMLVNELAEISGKIALHDQERKALLARQAIIIEKLQNLIKK